MPPILIDQSRKEIAIALARAGMTGYWITAFMGCDESTLREALAKDEMFRLRHLQARAEKQMELLGTIAKAARDRARVVLRDRHDYRRGAEGGVHVSRRARQ